MVSKNVIKFPKDFIWGVATSAYQIEGHTRIEGGGESIWDTFAKNGGTLNGDNGDIAADHFHKFKEDHKLAKNLGFKSFRLSFSWPRLSPDGSDNILQSGLDHYSRVLDSLLENNLIPMVTLYHWDLPNHLGEKGGWLNRDTAYRFSEYSEKIVKFFGDKVKYWTTTNEAWSCAFLGHARGLHAPGIKNYNSAGIAAHHLNLAHGLAIPAIRANVKSSKVGVVHCLQVIEEFSNEELDLEAARTVRGEANGIFLEPMFKATYPNHMFPYLPCLNDSKIVKPDDLKIISEKIDYLGLNYYVHEVVKYDLTIPQIHARRMAPLGPLTSIGSGLRPDGLEKILMIPKKDYNVDIPIFATEIGYLFNDYVNPKGEVNDKERIKYYDGALKAAKKAIDNGVDLRGFFPWTLLDDFEWDSGYSSRYGLVFVDYATQSRILKDSAYWFKNVIDNNGLVEQ